MIELDGLPEADTFELEVVSGCMRTKKDREREIKSVTEQFIKFGYKNLRAVRSTSRVHGVRLYKWALYGTK